MNSATTHPSRPPVITHCETRVRTILVLLFRISFSSLVAAKKWKRASSNTSQSAQISDPNRSSQSPPPLGTCLSTPTMIESKNAKKRHRRQERRQQKGGLAADSVSSAVHSSFSRMNVPKGLGGPQQYAILQLLWHPPPYLAFPCGRTSTFTGIITLGFVYDSGGGIYCPWPGQAGANFGT